MIGETIGMLPADAASLLPETFLGSLYLWGIEIVKAIQRIKSPALTAIVRFITELGTESFYLPMILFIFWWIDEKRGFRLGIRIIISAWINAVAKDLLKQPRPYNLDPSVGLAFESSYGAPSGHAQMAATFWISMGVWLQSVWKKKRALIWAGAVFLILLIAFTRLYLGAHFPTDIFAGWTIAGLLLVFWLIPAPRLEKLLVSAGPRAQSLAAAAIALAMNGAFPQERRLPALFLGFSLGYIMMKRRFPFFARAAINGKAPGKGVMGLRCLVGILGGAIIYLGLRLVLPGEGGLFLHPQWGEASPFYETGRFIRYGLIGLWASAGAPRIFQRMALAPPGDSAEPPVPNPGGADGNGAGGEP